MRADRLLSPHHAINEWDQHFWGSIYINILTECFRKINFGRLGSQARHCGYRTSNNVMGSNFRFVGDSSHSQAGPLPGWIETVSVADEIIDELTATRWYNCSCRVSDVPTVFALRYTSRYLTWRPYSSFISGMQRISSLIIVFFATMSANSLLCDCACGNASTNCVCESNTQLLSLSLQPCTNLSPSSLVPPSVRGSF